MSGSTATAGRVLQHREPCEFRCVHHEHGLGDSEHRGNRGVYAGRGGGEPGDWIGRFAAHSTGSESHMVENNSLSADLELPRSPNYEKI